MQEISKEQKSIEVLADEDFLFFKKKIFDLAGIHLTDKKKDLVKTRLQSYLRKSKISSFQELRQILESTAEDSTVAQTFINILTTNKTDFFREPQHFDFLVNTIIPQWKMNKIKEVRIWCCASSTGEEPYTIAMVLNRHLPVDMDYKILATDIDTNVLSRARNGVYPSSKLSEIPSDYHKKYLAQGSGTAEGWFKINDDLHSKIVFKQHNLIENIYPGDEVFDLIFCRNVLIYFSQETIKVLMTKLHKSLKNEAYLFIGHSESIQGTGHLFAAERPAIYTKVAT